MTSNIITKNFVPFELVFDTVSASETIDFTECKGEIDLILDTTGASSDATLTVCGGDYVGKRNDTQYIIPKGSVQCISISSGETMQADGCLHLAFANYTGVQLAVLARRYVTNH